MQSHYLQKILTVGLGATAFVVTLPSVHAESSQAAGLEEVFVTARKRDEGVQAVPISIAALSADVLSQRGVTDMQDLNKVVPGFSFGAQGGKGNTDVILRGLSKIPLGEGVSAVVTYFANIAMPAHAGNAPTFDLANIQVLKGPQGTLFGRNTLGGAVVITPVAPTYELGGYIKGDYGTKNYRAVEGAINVPIVDDKVALRVAGQLRRQDPLIKNLGGGPDIGDTHQSSFRASLLLNPIEGLESTTIYDRFVLNEKQGAERIFSVQPGFFPSLAAVQGLAAALGTSSPIYQQAAQFYGLGQQVIPQLNAAQAAQRAAGFWSASSNLSDGGAEHANSWGISNDTSFDTGVATIRNIFGYRRIDQFESIDTANAGNLTVTGPFGPGGANLTLPFVLFDAQQTIARKYVSDELQLFGSAMDSRLDWIVGAFYNKDENTGPSGATFTQFSVGAIPAPSITSLVENTNKSIFGQIGLDISEWTVDGLKFNVGLRETWDYVDACGGSIAGLDGFLSPGECKSSTSNTPTSEIGSISNSGKNLSWTIGLDWQITPDTLVYLTSRRGYRGVNVNTPLFQSQFTTGGTGCEFGTCPNLTGFQKTDQEKLTDVELGVKNDWNIGDVKGRINVATYLSKYKDAVQFLNVQALGIPNSTLDSPNNASVGVNAADLTIWGVEADLTVIPVDSLTVTFSGAYTNQTVDKVAPPSNGLSLSKSQITLPSPEFSGTLAVAWTMPLHPLDGDVILNADYYHTDKFSGQGGQNVPGYELANFRLDWKDIAKSKLGVAAYLKNAFDTQHYTSPDVYLKDGFPVQVLLQGTPREWGVEAKYTF